jgi:TfoX/Sxy family transcriptional regulator of competence genes
MPDTARPSRMPKFTPAPEAVVNFFRTAMEGLPEVELRKMFGYPCAFVRGQMLTGVFQDRIMLRLSDQDRAKFLKLPGAKPFEPMPGRVMREYVELPPDLRHSPAGFKRWLKLGLAYVETLPPKTKKAKSAKAGQRYESGT